MSSLIWTYLWEQIFQITIKNISKGITITNQLNNNKNKNDVNNFLTKGEKRTQKLKTLTSSLLREKDHPLTSLFLAFFKKKKKSRDNPIKEILSWKNYSSGRLIGSRITESAAYRNHIFLVPVYLSSTQNTSANWIIWLLISLYVGPKWSYKGADTVVINSLTKYISLI